MSYLFSLSPSCHACGVSHLIESPWRDFLHRPLLSREIVRKNPQLKGRYQEIEKAFVDEGYSKVKQMTYDLADEIGSSDRFTRTVIADAKITCSEFFQVKDARTGVVVQGMEDGQEEEEVVHMLRFEVVTTKDSSDDGWAREVGSWKIIDFDDMLDGNVFH